MKVDAASVRLSNVKAYIGALLLYAVEITRRFNERKKRERGERDVHIVSEI